MSDTRKARRSNDERKLRHAAAVRAARRLVLTYSDVGVSPTGMQALERLCELAGVSKAEQSTWRESSQGGVT